MKNIAVCDGFIGLEPGCYSMGVSHPEAFAAGTNLVLNSAEAPFTALTVYGHSTQETTTGAQLIDASKIPSKTQGGATLTNNGDGSFTISGEGELTDDFLISTSIPINEARQFLKEGYLYTNGSRIVPSFYCYTEGATNNASTSNSGKTNITAEILDEMTAFKIVFFSTRGKTITPGTFWPMMWQDGNGTWEPFTGGKPSPSPEYPQPIVSAGSGGEIGVTVQGGNLSGELKIGYINDIEGIISEDEKYRSILIDTLPGTYTLSANTNIYIIREIINNEFKMGEKQLLAGNSLSWNVTSPGRFGLSFRRLTNGEIWDDNTEVMLNLGSTPLPYEPYKQPQTLTLSAPGGLPGIPVDASKLPEGMTPTYVDESGQAWVCDEVDFEKGVYVRRVWRKTLDGTESWSKYGTPTSVFYGFILGILPELSYRKSGFCNQFIVSNIAHENTEEIWLGANNNSIYCLGVSFYDASLPDSGLSNWKAHLAAHPLEVMTYLTTATEEPLTAEEIAAYKALHTYSPDTTVSNDAGAWMEVGYYGLTAIQKLEKEALLINGGKSK